MTPSLGVSPLLPPVLARRPRLVFTGLLVTEVEPAGRRVTAVARIRLSPEAVAERSAAIIAGLKAGRPPSVLADEFDVCPTHVRAIGRKAGVWKGPQRTPEEMAAIRLQIATLRGSMTQRAIAKMLDVSAGFVCRELQDLEAREALFA